MYYEIPDTSVRLLGSMRRLPLEAPEIPAWVDSAYRWCEELYLEHDSAPFSGLSVRTGGPVLQAFLAPSVWHAMQTRWPNHSGMVAIDSLKPWAAMIVVSAVLQPAAPGVEAQFMRFCGADQKPLRYLESAEQAAASFDAVPVEEIAECVSTQLADSDGSKNTLADIHKAWVARDRAQFDAVASRFPFNSLPQFRRLLLEERNRAWAETIRPLMRSRTRTLVCVGAMHLCGPSGLLALLEGESVPVAT